MQVGIATGFAAGAAARVRDARRHPAQWRPPRSRRPAIVPTSCSTSTRWSTSSAAAASAAAAALIGSALAVKPILTLEDGVVTPLEKVRTSSKALARLVALAVETVGAYADDYDIGVQHLASEPVARGRRAVASRRSWAGPRSRSTRSAPPSGRTSGPA